MAWPSGTKASTANVDAGTDQPKLARADIKQNIDNVNSIIDTFDIASPTNGDLLQYNSTSGAWEPVASSSIGSNVDFALVEFNAADGPVSGNTSRKPTDEEFDPNGIVDITSPGDYTFSLGAGNYIVEIATTREVDTEADITLYNETDSASLGLVARYIEIGTVGQGIYGNTRLGFTLSGTKSLSLRQTVSLAANRNSVVQLKITKF